MDYLRVFFLTFFLVIMTAWVVVMVPVLSSLSKGAFTHPCKTLIASSPLLRAPMPRIFAVPSGGLLL